MMIMLRSLSWSIHDRSANSAFEDIQKQSEAADTQQPRRIRQICMIRADPGKSQSRRASREHGVMYSVKLLFHSSLTLGRNAVTSSSRDKTRVWASELPYGDRDLGFSRVCILMLLGRVSDEQRVEVGGQAENSTWTRIR